LKSEPDKRVGCKIHYSLVALGGTLEMQEYEELKQLVAEIETDINKAEGGNKAAGTRVRKQMQTIKQAAQTVRNKVLELRAED
jgi:hypothetical protein